MLTRFAYDSARQALRLPSSSGASELAWATHGSYQIEGMDEPVELHRALGELLQEMHESQVCWVYPAGPGPALVGIAHLHHDPREPRRFATVAGALADLDALELQPERLRAARARAARPLRTRLDRLDRAVEKLRTEAAEADGRGELEEHAHTLLAFGSRLPRGLSEVELPRMSDPSEKLRIPLDPLFNGVENATRKLRTASRLARRVEVLQRRRAQVDRDREDLARAEALVRGHADWRELESLGVLEEERSAENFKPVDHTPTPDEVMRTTTSEGWAVLIGRNARQNDFLTHQLARPGDLWFHAESVPGSHVVLRVGSRAGEPSAAAVEEAAAYAAFFSKSRNSSLVPVLVAEKRHVRRTRGGPGKVVVERGKTLMVAPRKPMNPNSGP